MIWHRKKLKAGNAPLAGMWLGIALSASAAVSEPGDFFEKQIRPQLAEHCYACHSSATHLAAGGLRLDTVEGLKKGGHTGELWVAGKPDESLLIVALKSDAHQALKGWSKDSVSILGDWITQGAKLPTSAVQGVPPASSWWSFQPVRKAKLPPLPVGTAVSSNPIDAFVAAKLAEKDLQLSGPADRGTLVRRMTFDLTGLPPTPAEVEAFVNDEKPGSVGRLIERLLDSPAYGERWARHWLDVVRYTDSFDARILSGGGRVLDCTEAWRYRDWVVNAFNRDMPYNQFVQQQVAGDIMADRLPEADFDPGMVVATGIFAIGNWGGGDADKEKLLTDIADDQVDLVSRAFLGLTIGCARCHDHKFDPISTEDYYALAGIFFSSHILPNPGPKTNGPDMLRVALAHRAELARRAAREAHIKSLAARIAAIRDEQHALAATRELKDTSRYLTAAFDIRSNTNHTVEALAGERGLHPAVLRRWMDATGPLKLAALTKRVKNVEGVEGLLAWIPEGSGNPSATANTTSETKGFAAIKLPPKTVAIHPAPSTGVAVGWRSPISGKVKLSGKMADADAGCGNGIEWTLSLRRGASEQSLTKGAFDNGGSAAKDALDREIEVREGDVLQLAVFPKGDYSCDTTITDLDLTELGGSQRHWNLTQEIIADFHGSNPHIDAYGNAGTWVFYDLAGAGGIAPPPENSALAKAIHLIESTGGGAAEPGERAVLFATAAKEMTEGSGFDVWKLPNGAFWAPLRDDTTRYELAARESLQVAETELADLKNHEPPALPMAHALQEGGCPESPQAGVHDVKVHIRGRYDRLGAQVSRGFPHIIAGTNQPPVTSGSGRLELASWLAEPGNPLVARVMVNRIWQQHFGVGLVRTANNFGKLGDPPTHPELLDWLADEFIKSGWSIKAMHRLILSSRTYQQASSTARGGSRETAAKAFEKDPENRFLWHFPRRRLESEALRDSLLFVGRRLDQTRGGPSIRELDTPRRTLYVMTIRSDRATYQSLFDAADPTGISERRIDSTVAPQALWLLNHPFAIAQAHEVVERMMREAPSGAEARIGWLYRELFGRAPSPKDLAIGLPAVSPGSGAWDAYVQVLLCSNEFIYID